MPTGLTPAMQTSLSGVIAEFICADHTKSITDAAIDAAKKAIADALAVTIAGTNSELMHPLEFLCTTGGVDQVALVGTSRSASREHAALIHGGLSHALVFDDVMSLLPGHPSGVLLASLLSTRPGRGSHGRHFIDAFIIGLEVATKLAIGLTRGHYERGFHATSTLGTFGAVAAACRLAGLTSDKVQHALGIAASMSSGVQANFGTTGGTLHSGLAARSGWLAMRLAEEGMTASPSIFEAPGGYFDAFGAADSDTSITDEGLGKDWAILHPGLSLKKYPGCYAAHRPIEGLRHLMEQMDVSLDDVASVRCELPMGGMRPLKYSRPQNALEARFSGEYALAAELVDRSQTIWTYTDAALHRSSILAALDRIELVETEEMSQLNPLASASVRGQVRVTLRRRDGTSGQRIVDLPPGHSSSPLSWDEIEDKFVMCCDHASFSGAGLFKAIRDLDQQPDIGVLERLWATAPS